MIAEYYKQFQKYDCCHSGADHMRCKKYTYTSCLEYLDKNGIIVKMPSQAAEPLKISDTAMNAIGDVTDNACQPDHFDQELLNEEDSFVSSLLRCKKWWGESEADVFVTGNIFTGISSLTDKSTLRVDNGTHSYIIPIEKIECIRTTDSLNATLRTRS